MVCKGIILAEKRYFLQFRAIFPAWAGRPEIRRAYPTFARYAVDNKN